LFFCSSHSKWIPSTLERYQETDEKAILIYISVYGRFRNLTEMTKTDGLLLMLLKGSPFDSTFAPPAGLEPATGRLTLPLAPLIEDTICLLHIKCRNQRKEELRRSSSPIYNLALVAFAF
jgi:hypothetical protein